jgi:hypothetical protein
VFTDEVNDEATVGAATRGSSEELGAVGKARDGVEHPIVGKHDRVVAGVGVRIAEAEDGRVSPM